MIQRRGTSTKKFFVIFGLCWDLMEPEGGQSKGGKPDLPGLGLSQRGGRAGQPYPPTAWMKRVDWAHSQLRLTLPLAYRHRPGYPEEIIL